MEVLGIEKVAPWMRDVIDEAEASGDAYRVCAAVGTIARLWTPRDGGLHPQSLASLLSDGRNPVTRCRAWFTALPAKVIEHVHAIGSYSADGIHDHCFFYQPLCDKRHHFCTYRNWYCVNFSTLCI
jgi:hypothetical protein